jgi:AcrR family transcriptional regulator
MWYMSDARTALLERVVTYATVSGIAGKSLREIAAGVGTSHRMLIYHFGSHEGLMAAIVGVIEANQRAAMAALSGPSAEVMRELWHQVSRPELRPFVRLFFEVVGQAVQGAPGTRALLTNLTEPWIREGVAAAARLGVDADPAALRLGVAVSRGLLLDLLAGDPPEQVEAAYEYFVARYAQDPHDR